MADEGRFVNVIGIAKMCLNIEKIKAFLLDIEGTTTSISFVKDVLFPYVKDRLSNYLDAHWENNDIQKVVAELAAQNDTDIQDGLTDAVPISGLTGDAMKAAVIANVLWQMKLDRKTTALKKLQGLMWTDAYVNKQIQGHVYEDVVPALKAWRGSAKKIFIYSSGSVQAQKLLFGYSIDGDLTEYLDGYFDTTVGAKISNTSYTAICSKIEMKPDDVLFLTDIPKEAVAAKGAGLHVLLVTRPGNAALATDDINTFSTVSTFKELHT